MAMAMAMAYTVLTDESRYRNCSFRLTEFREFRRHTNGTPTYASFGQIFMLFDE